MSVPNASADVGEDRSDEPATPSRRKLLRAGVAAVVVGAGAVAATRTLGRDPRQTPSLVVGRPAPPLGGRTLDGSTTDLASFADHVVLVNVWASWCAPCRAEYPVLRAAASGLRDRGLRLLGINTQDTETKATAFLDELGGESYPSIVDADGRISVAWGTSGVPETFLIDRGGFVRERLVGEVSEQWVTDRVLPLLGG